MIEIISSLGVIAFCICWIVLMIKISSICKEIADEPRKKIERMIRMEELKEKMREENSVCFICEQCGQNHKFYIDDFLSISPIFNQNPICAPCGNTLEYRKILEKFLEEKA